MESDTSRLSRTVSRGAATAWAAAPPRAGRGLHAMTAAAVIQAPIRPPRTKCFVLTSRPPRWCCGSRGERRYGCVSSMGTLYCRRISVVSPCRRAITAASVALSALSRCRTATAKSNRNGVPATGSRCRDAVEDHRGLDHQVAESAEDGGSQEATAAGAQVVDDRRVEISRDEVGDLVLESLLLIVGEGQVVGIGADPEVRGRPGLRTGHEGHAGGGDE